MQDNELKSAIDYLQSRPVAFQCYVPIYCSEQEIKCSIGRFDVTAEDVVKFVELAKICSAQSRHCEISMEWIVELSNPHILTDQDRMLICPDPIGSRGCYPISFTQISLEVDTLESGAVIRSTCATIKDLVMAMARAQVEGRTDFLLDPNGTFEGLGDAYEQFSLERDMATTDPMIDSGARAGQ